MDGPLGLFSRLMFVLDVYTMFTYLLILKFKSRFGRSFFYATISARISGQNAKSAMRSMRSASKSTKSSTNYKKFEFENRGPLPSDFGFQSGSKVEIYIILPVLNSTYGFCCNPYTLVICIHKCKVVFKCDTHVYVTT